MALYHSPSIVTSGLTLYLDAANPRSYPGSGTTWFDLSGNGNSGGLSGGPTFNSANGGNIVFDGVNDFCTGPNFSTVLNRLTSGTINIFFRILSAPPQNFVGICGFHAGGPNRIIWLETAEAASDIIRIVWRLSDGSLGSINSNIRPSTNRDINCLTFTYQIVSSNIVFNLYQNGLLIGSSTVTGSLTEASFVPFKIGITDHNYTNINVYLAQIYNRVLSPIEVAQNFNAIRGRFGI